MATAKRTPPAFQFYAGDWLTSTLGMAWEVKGMYIDLLCWSWENGPLPDDPAWRQRVLGSSAARCWAVLQSRWKQTPKGWVNPRLERQRKVQAAFSAHAQHAAGIRWASIGHRSGMASGIARAMPKRCSSSSSSSSDQDQPAAQRPVYAPAFKVYCAIAKQVLLQTEDLDLAPSDLAEEFKRACAKARLPYNATIIQKAMDAAQTARRRA